MSHPLGEGRRLRTGLEGFKPGLGACARIHGICEAGTYTLSGEKIKTQMHLSAITASPEKHLRILLFSFTAHVSLRL